MAALTLFPLQYQRQSAEPIDIDQVFLTTADRVAYLSSPRRYGGMLVADLETESAYILNTARDTWLSLGGDDVVFMFQVGAPVLGHTHQAPLTFAQARFLVQGTSPIVGIGPTLVITTEPNANSGDPLHTHDLTIAFDWHRHSFVVSDISNNVLDNHVAFLIGSNVTYSADYDMLQYYGAGQQLRNVGDPKIVNVFDANWTASNPSDAGTMFRFFSATDREFQLVAASTFEHLPGTTFIVSRNDAGEVEITHPVGVTVNTPETLFIGKTNGKATVTYVGGDEWDVEGNLTPA